MMVVTGGSSLVQRKRVEEECKGGDSGLEQWVFTNHGWLEFVEAALGGSK